MRADDRRLNESMVALNTYLEEIAERQEDKPETGIPQGSFARAIRNNILLIERALQGSMTIPDFADFCEDIRGKYEATLANRSGEAANYIPQLDLKEPEVDQYGVAVCTIDGQRFSIGDPQEFFSVQSTAKPIMYCLALEEHGVEKVHQHVGHDPSGGSFNELALNRDGQPHNPLINAGAIISCSLIKLKEKQEKEQQGSLTEMDRRGWAGTRLDYLMGRWQALSGGVKPRFSSPVYLSERNTADRNYALGYFMREKGAFPEGMELEDVLDFYTNCWCRGGLSQFSDTGAIRYLALIGVLETSRER